MKGIYFDVDNDKWQEVSYISKEELSLILGCSSPKEMGLLKMSDEIGIIYNKETVNAMEVSHLIMANPNPFFVVGSMVFVGLNYDGKIKSLIDYSISSIKSHVLPLC